VYICRCRYLPIHEKTSSCYVKLDTYVDQHVKLPYAFKLGASPHKSMLQGSSSPLVTCVGGCLAFLTNEVLIISSTMQFSSFHSSLSDETQSHTDARRPVHTTCLGCTHNLSRCVQAFVPTPPPSHTCLSQQWQHSNVAPRRPEALVSLRSQLYINL